ncbi:MAG TPA: MerR family transcriptional regulator [Nitrospiraceae bacterium]|jgi:MerR family transcriptional regulator, heat shock protein HspR|nr:MerR family transcriptional regulator [Nitrospiraceae bacterium]
MGEHKRIMVVESIDFLKDKDTPLYTMGVAARLVGTTAQTLRLYEKHGLITPTRERRNRLYTENDIKWLRCIRELIHSKKISIEGIKKLLDYAPCWEIKDCPDDRRQSCTAFTDKGKPCWELTRCQRDGGCDTCVVFLRNGKKAAKKV